MADPRFGWAQHGQVEVGAGGLFVVEPLHEEAHRHSERGPEPVELGLPGEHRPPAGERGPEGEFPLVGGGADVEADLVQALAGDHGRRCPLPRPRHDAEAEPGGRAQHTEPGFLEHRRGPGLLGVPYEGRDVLDAEVQVGAARPVGDGLVLEGRVCAAGREEGDELPVLPSRGREGAPGDGRPESADGLLLGPGPVGEGVDPADGGRRGHRSSGVGGVERAKTSR